jgi:hypothetical protein
MIRRRTVLVFVAVAALSPGCGTQRAAEAPQLAVQETAPPAPEPSAGVAQPTAPAAERVRLTDGLSLGDSSCVGNLDVWPIYSDARVEAGRYVTLPEAARAGKASVRECGVETPDLSFDERFRELQARRSAGRESERDAGSRVDTLVIDNAGREPLLVCAGTLVRGGDQDRVLAEDVVVAADSAALVNVFCVEPLRWDAVREGQATNGRFEAVDCVAVSPVRAAGQYQRSQTDVWQNVAAVNQSAGVASSAPMGTRGPDTVVASSSLFASVDDRRSDPRGARDATVAELLRVFKGLENADSAPVGFAYSVAGRVVGAHAFATPEMFRARFAAYAQSMAMESWLARSAVAAERPATAKHVATLVRSIEEAGGTTEDRGAWRVTTRRAFGGWSTSCAVTEKGKVVTLSQDWIASRSGSSR